MFEQVNSYVVVLVPKKAFVTWLNHVIETLEIDLPDEFSNPEAVDLYQDAALILTPPFVKREDFEKYIKEHYKGILITALIRWCGDIRFWPLKKKEELTYELFTQFFDLELHSYCYQIKSKKQGGEK